MKAIHTFADSLASGQRSEVILDAWMRHRGYEVTEVPMDEQRRGIDRVAVGPDGVSFTVEYKADSQGHRTGRGFIESISVDTSGKAGWLHTCQADWLIYYTKGDGKGRVLRPDDLRSNAFTWTRNYEVKTASNRGGYHSFGLMVPLAELDRIAIELFTWPEEPA